MSPDEILDKVKVLPPNPQVACKLMGLLKSNTQDNRDVVETIRYDAALTARLLKVCNSSFFARGGRIGSVEQAVLQLGYQEISRIVMALGVGKSLAVEQKGYGMGKAELWRHTVVTATASQKLADHCKVPMEDAQLIFTGGLLHDIGKTVLSEYLSPDLQQSIQACIKNENASMFEAETTIIGTNHAHVGGCLLARWKLPATIVEAVTHHHKPPLKSPKLSALIHIADCTAHFMGSSYGWDSMAVRLEEEAMQALGLTTVDIERTMIDIHEESNRIEAFMGIV